jgi:hypothetical protein
VETVLNGANGTITLGTSGLVAASGETITVGTGTFAIDEAYTLPGGTVLDGTDGIIKLGNSALTVSAGKVITMGSTTFTADAAIATVLPGGTEFDGVNATIKLGAGGLTIADTETITVGSATFGATNAAVTLSANTVLDTKNAEITLGDGDVLEIKDGATLTIASGTIELPNTTIDAGVYTAAGDIQIRANIDLLGDGTKADDIFVIADAATDGLTVGTLVLGTSGGGGEAAVTLYEFRKSASGDKIVLNGTAASGSITIPAASNSTAENSGANVRASTYAAIELESGTIKLGRKSSGNGAGFLKVRPDFILGTFTGTNANTGTKIAAAANLAKADGTAAEAVDGFENDSSKLILQGELSIYGATGDTNEGTIAAGTALE